jgi:YfiH family protein
VSATEFLVADWPGPPGIRAIATTRAGGASAAPWGSLNLGDHVGDAPAAVAANRALLAEALGLPAAPAWLRQVHGTAVVDAAGVVPGQPPAADASFTTQPGVVCAVLTADCLPVVLAAGDGRAVAVAHAGWRGLAGGVLEATVAALGTAGVPPGELVAWLGPAIGPAAYEVGAEVRAALLAGDAGADAALAPGRPGHWWLDLYAAARRRLATAGVAAVHGGGLCTAGDSLRFFSHRRDGTTGRQATLAWRA